MPLENNIQFGIGLNEQQTALKVVLKRRAAIVGSSSFVSFLLKLQSA